MVQSADPTKGGKKHGFRGKNTPRVAGTIELLKQKNTPKHDRNKHKVGAILQALKAKNKEAPNKPSLDTESISPKELENALIFLKKRNMTVSDFVSEIKNAKALESKLGKPYQAILVDYETKIEQVRKAIEGLKETEDLKSQLEARISNLKGLEELQGLLEGVEVDEISDYIRQYKKLGQFGFDVKTVRLIAEEVKRLQFDPKEVSTLVEGWLTKYMSINEALVRAEAGVNEAKQEQVLTTAKVKSLEQKADEAQKKIESLENYYVRRSESLEADYKNRERVLDTRYLEERSRAEAELFDILRERDKMRTENRSLKDELETTRRDIDLSKSISMIIRDPNSLTSSQIDLLISEFTKAKEIRQKENTVIPSPSSERLIQARQMLVSTLRDLPNLAG